MILTLSGTVCSWSHVDLLVICVASDRLCSDDDDTAKGPSKQKQKAAAAKIAALKVELKAMLAQPLVARGVSTRYITSGVHSIADDMVAGECKLAPPGSSLFGLRCRSEH